MRLYELAMGCWVYRIIAGDDSSMTQLWEATGGQVDPSNPAHRKCLFEWLRQWGCRQFSKADQANAEESLVDWAGEWLTRLPAREATLEAIDDAQVGEISNAYHDLRTRQAGKRTLPGGSISHVTYGPVGAAKTLFALRPNICPPWDSYILHALGLDPYSRTSYGRYLRWVLSDLREVSAEAGVHIAKLPTLLERAKSTPPKLIDEYYWVTVTKGFKPPPPQTLNKWLGWANLE
jgi:hypothetical protein